MAGRSVALKFFEEQKEETQKRVEQDMEKYRKGNRKIKLSKKAEFSLNLDSDKEIEFFI